MRSIFIFFLILTFSSFFFWNCAGTQGAEEETSFDDSNQEDLDDIEKLLGISNDSESVPPAKKTQEKASGEKLSLLDSEIKQKEGGSSSSSYQAAALAATQTTPTNNNEVVKLKKQVQKKDDEISNLKAKLVSQDSEIQRLSMQKGSTAVYSGGPVSDVAPEEYQSRYDEARAAFEARSYQHALQLFESLLASSTSQSLSDNAQFWIGESHYALRQYNSAIIAFEKVFTFPKSNKKADAQFKLGLCYVRKGENAKATEEFKRLKAEYPNSNYISKAEKVMAKF